MAIQKEIIVDEKATPITYWKYSGFERMVNNLIVQNTPTDDNGAPIKQTAIVVRMDGYSTAQARQDAKANLRLADASHEFLISNWQENIEHTRPATLEEKKAVPQIAAMVASGTSINDIPYDILLSVEKILHADYDEYKADLNTAQEAATAYRLLKSHPSSSGFFANSTDI